MRALPPQRHLWTTAALLVVLGGCQQADQMLPFDLTEGESTALTVGSSGGTLSVPPFFSIEIPPGALEASITVDVSPRVSDPYPDDRGTPVPGTTFDVGPVGAALAVPARVEVAVDAELLEAAEAVRLALAVVRADGSVETIQGSYDFTSGLFIAFVDELGPMAAVVSDDAIAVDPGEPPTLDGGVVAPPSAPATSGPAGTSHGGVEFTASCAPDARQCFSSGLIRLWADEVVQERLGEDIFLLRPEIDATLDFISFDADGLPTEVVGSLIIGGQLRARLKRLILADDVDDGATTGPSTDPVPTSLVIEGNVMTISQTTAADGTVELDEEVEFAVTGIGTSEMLTVEVDVEIDFKNEDGTTITGIVTAHIRLRR